jgi:NADH:ubiquinone oxidoreductase subunit F (NADH-binding)
MSQQDIIDLIKSTRGRRGRLSTAGHLRQRDLSQKYIICNADVRDPGAFMDRSVIEGNPMQLRHGRELATGADKVMSTGRVSLAERLKRLSRPEKHFQEKPYNKFT